MNILLPREQSELIYEQKVDPVTRRGVNVSTVNFTE